jgi:segregation and condensation protein B
LSLTPEDAWPPEASANSVNAVRQAEQHLKGQIEAALFLTAKPLSIKELADILETFSSEVESALMALMHDYACREDGALDIDDTDETYMLQVKEAYLPLVQRMLPMELSQGATRTLSAIALKAPIAQKDLIEWRGSGAYEHIQELQKQKLISKKRQGRSYLIDVTSKFRQYFKLQQNLTSLQLQTLMENQDNDFADPLPDDDA